MEMLCLRGRQCFIQGGCQFVARLHLCFFIGFYGGHLIVHRSLACFNGIFGLFKLVSSSFVTRFLAQCFLIFSFGSRIVFIGESLITARDRFCILLFGSGRFYGIVGILVPIIPILVVLLAIVLVGI